MKCYLGSLWLSGIVEKALKFFNIRDSKWLSSSTDQHMNFLLGVPVCAVRSMQFGVIAAKGNGARVLHCP